jgi:hypothetical protein
MKIFSLTGEIFFSFWRINFRSINRCARKEEKHEIKREPFVNMQMALFLL